MSLILRVYLMLLPFVVFGWLYWRAFDLFNLSQKSNWVIWIGIMSLYLFAHLLRMLRLVLLALDDRSKAFTLISAHALTAFPSSFLPFKLGEILRLAAFSCVFKRQRKAFAVWLVERFWDVIVISIFIVSLYLLKVSIPSAMRLILILFLFVSGFGLLSFFAVSRIFIYLNRHLVLTSLTSRGLTLLRVSNFLRCLEAEIYKSVEGRITGLFLISVLVWSFEILALSLFIRQIAVNELDFAGLFSSGLLASLPGRGENSFGIYQSLALIALTSIFLFVVWVGLRLKIMKL